MDTERGLPRHEDTIWDRLIVDFWHEQLKKVWSLSFGDYCRSECKKKKWQVRTRGSLILQVHTTSSEISDQMKRKRTNSSWSLIFDLKHTARNSIVWDHTHAIWHHHHSTIAEHLCFLSVSCPCERSCTDYLKSCQSCTQRWWSSWSALWEILKQKISSIGVQEHLCKTKTMKSGRCYLSPPLDTPVHLILECKN